MTDTKPQRLLPCPFCGGEAEWVDYVEEVAVRCGSCSARVSRKHNWLADTGLSEAIATWNTRADLSAAERNKVLEEVLNATESITGWSGEPYQSNMDYGPNIAVKFRAAIRALKSKE